MHATEEAAAAFISAAKTRGHNEYAKQVSLRDHLSKALVSILAQRLSNIVAQENLAVGVHWTNGSLVFRVPKGDGHQYGDLHLSTFRIGCRREQDIDGFTRLGDIPLLDELREEVKKGADARNKLIYASGKGFPSGFTEPKFSLIREPNLSPGLILAAVGLHIHPEQGMSFVDDILKQMAAFNAARERNGS